MRRPWSLRGPSQILFIACASAAVRQFGAAGAPGSPQTLACASNLQRRGSARRPSVTPSSASHAATAAALAALRLPLVMVPAGLAASPVIARLTHHGHSVVSCRRELKLAGAPTR